MQNGQKRLIWRLYPMITFELLEWHLFDALTSPKLNPQIN